MPGSRRPMRLLNRTVAVGVGAVCVAFSTEGVAQARQPEARPDSPAQARSSSLAQADIPSGTPGTDSTGGSPNAGPSSSAAANLGDHSSGAIPEILVHGSKILNMDIARSRDDAQPYVIFEREAIARSGATSIDEFLNRRLPMNAVSFQNAQTANVTGSNSRINLRGLGTHQTLILIDGHRVASPLSAAQLGQPDLSSIPLAAIERIEVLPTTASGIYGGSATGGVINVVLRRDYVGTEVGVNYSNSFDTDTAQKRVDMTTGFTFEGGRSSALLTASYSDSNPLLVGDRDFADRGIAQILANNRDSLLNATTPPLGATTNIRSTTGADLVLDDGTPLNSPITFVPAGYGGRSTDEGAALVANAGQYNFARPDTAQGVGKRAGLLSETRTRAVNLTLHREFTPRVRGFLELGGRDSLSRFANSIVSGNYTIRADAPNNPFRQDIRVTVPTSAGDGVVDASIEQERALAGVIVGLPAGWQAEADYTWDRASVAFQQTGALIGSETPHVIAGTIDVLRDPSAYDEAFLPYRTLSVQEPFDTTMRDATLRFAGSVGHLPGGRPTLSFLVEHREESFSGGTWQVTPTLARSFSDQRQSVDSAYVETRLPLISQVNRRTGAEWLELQLAARRDEYTTVAAPVLLNPAPGATSTPVENRSHSVDPTIGVRFQPVQSLMLRASYGTGFLPPAVNQLAQDATIVLPANALGIRDPRRGNETLGPVALTGGGNPDLKPEESESWSAGFVLTPALLPGFRLSIDWTRIDKVDNIVLLPPAQFVNFENLLPERVIRAAAAPGDPFGVGPIVGIDFSQINLSRAEVEAWDLALDYRLTTARRGAFTFSLLGTYQPHYRTQLAPDQPIREMTGLGDQNPLKLKGHASIQWDLRSWTFGWIARYMDSYFATDPTGAATADTILNQGNGGRVPSQTYHDAFATYRFPAPAPMIESAEAQLGIKNVFNKEPPVDMAAANPSYYYSRYGDPRLATYYLSFKFGF